MKTNLSNEDFFKYGFIVLSALNFYRSMLQVTSFGIFWVLGEKKEECPIKVEWLHFILSRELLINVTSHV